VSIIETPRSEKIEVTLSAISIARIWLLVRDMTMLSSILSHGLQSWEGSRRMFDGGQVEFLSNQGIMQM
jgi:hypothetical protein